MVFPGGRSRGCYHCRQRKIKCDEVRPACQRCWTYGIQCPGYPDTYILQVDKSQVSKSNIVQVCTPSPESVRSSTPEEESKQIARRLSTPLEEQAVCFFVNQYRISAGSDGAAGFLDCLPDLLRSSDEPDSLQFALHAVADLALYHRIGARSLHVDARRSYGAALTSINNALVTPEEACSDRTFAAVLLLSLFVDVAGERQGVVNQHTAGIYHLMRLRGSRNFSSSSGSSLFSWGITHTMQHFLITGEYQCASLADLFNVATESSHWHRALTIGGKISLFVAMTNQLLQAAGIPPLQVTSSSPKPAPDLSTMGHVQVQTIFDFSVDIREEIGKWYRTVPENWKYPSSEPSPPEECTEENQDVLEMTPRGLWASSYVANFYCAEIVFYMRLIFCMMLAASPMCDWSSEGESQELLQQMDSFGRRIRLLLHKLCILIPTILEGQPSKSDPEGLVGGSAGAGYMLMWPLWLTVNCPFASREQVEMCRKALNHIGATMGFRLATDLSTRPV